MRRFSILRGERATEHSVYVELATAHGPELVTALLEMDLGTFSEPTLSRATAAALLRHGQAFLLRADGHLVGACLCIRTWGNPDEAALVHQAIRTGWRGFGLGSWFLEQVLQGLAHQGLSSIVLHVACENTRARHLYEDKYDFVPVTDCELDYGTGQGRVMMRRWL
ncbi:MAG: GNAT family N-acetyltransferase [Pseudomonadota bacterium]